MGLFLLVIADLPARERATATLPSSCKSSARRALSDIYELRALDTNTNSRYKNHRFFFLNQSLKRVGWSGWDFFDISPIFKQIVL